MNDTNDRPRPANQSPQQPVSKIRHSQPGIGGAANPPSASSLPDIGGTHVENAETDASLPVAEDGGFPGMRPRIVALGSERKHEENWRRTPNTTGSGAIHVRTFHTKLTDDALVYMDRMINEWLDAHPQYEVKFVNATIGILTGKIKEPHLICQVWV